MKKEWPLFVANEPEQPNLDLSVTDKFTGEVFAKVAMADPAMISRAIGAAHDAAEPMRKLPSYARQAVLNHCVKRFQERFDELAESLCAEAGKPIKDAKGETTRLIDTFRYAAEESVRMTGEVMDMEISERARGRRGFWKRYPIGPCSFISPFNFPLNLAAHKVAPAIAVGCPFVLKPASLTPLGALIIGEALAETDLPKGAFSILPCSRAGADLFTTDERLKLLSFTGSPGVGWELKKKAGKKKVVLELGGNAACIVDADADLEDAAARIVIGAFYQSGQSCIGVQRILIHEAIYDEMRQRLVDATKALVMGNPRDPKTFIGPMISEKEATRLAEWIETAVKGGAKLLCGGERKGAMLAATLLEDAPKDSDVVCKEAFGPVAILSKFADFDEALRQVNDSVFGLQAGIFTRDIFKAMKAWDELDVGGVVIGDVPSWRVDHMPYGGVKDSGLGREGIKFAMEDMTEVRLMVLREPKIMRARLTIAMACALWVVGCDDGGETTSAGAGDCDVCDAPPESDGMYALLSGGDYTGWDKESGAHNSTGPHGSSVLVYISPVLSASLAAGNPSHARGSAVVKELLDGSGTVTGWASWVKTADDSADGNNIYWYENFNTATNSPIADSFGPPGCTNCHSGGLDFLQIPYPLQ